MRRIYCDMRKCASCRSCEMACALAHSESGDVYLAMMEVARPRHLVTVKPSQLGPLPLRCHHCESAACIDACKTGAMHRDPITGSVLIDRERCVGCWMCIMVCPFGGVFSDPDIDKARKCDLCADKASPACVNACPTKALYYAEFEAFQEAREKDRAELVATGQDNSRGGSPDVEGG